MNRSTLVVGIVMVLAIISTRWLRVNMSPSVPRGLYLLSAVPDELVRGTLVVLPVPASIQHLWHWWVPLLKPVAGIAGDLMCVWEERPTLRVGNYSPLAMQPVPPGCQVVPEGMVFLASPAPHSLDGRYFGMTPVDTLRATATPLFTWKE